MNLEKLAPLFLRISLAASYVSAVADRFGLWGGEGSPGVVWANFQNFTAYTGSLLFFFPEATHSFFAWSATILEILLGFFLIIGFRLKETSFLSFLLLSSFGLSMIKAYGLKAPLDYSVFTACSGSLVLFMLSLEMGKLKNENVTLTS